MCESENSVIRVIEMNKMITMPIPNPEFTADRLELFSDEAEREDAASKINSIIQSSIKVCIENGFDGKFENKLIRLIRDEMNKSQKYFSQMGAYDSEPQSEIKYYCEQITEAFKILYNYRKTQYGS